MERANLILGSITFLDERADGEHKAIVHRIDCIIGVELERADIVGESMLENYESYLIPEQYKGVIEYECEIPNLAEEKQIYRIFETK